MEPRAVEDFYARIFATSSSLAASGSLPKRRGDSDAAHSKPLPRSINGRMVGGLVPCFPRSQKYLFAGTPGIDGIRKRASGRSGRRDFVAHSSR